MNKKLEKLLETWMAELEGPNGFELSRFEYVKEGSERHLRVYVDKLENGEYTAVSTDDCEMVSKFLGQKLDEEDPIAENYFLEVSSPGLDRPLIKDKDFERFKGELVDVKLYKAFEGKKTYQGVLKDHDGETVTVETEEKDVLFDMKDVSKIQLAVVF